MKKRIYLTLLVIIITSFLLRFYQITKIPPSLNWDEVAIGYNAYSILKTGKDEWGVFLPIHFKSYGEYKLPMQIYATIPAIALFGLNDFAVRITPVLYGTLTVLLLFFLGRNIFKNDYVGLVSAFFLGISPWHIQLTRASFESSFSVFWIVLAVWLLIKGLESLKERKTNIWIVLSVLFFSISIYTYNSARVFSPIFLLALILFYRKTIRQNLKTAIIALCLFLILMIPLVLFILQTGGNSRYKLVSITDEAGLIPRIEYNRNHSNLPGLINDFVNNRYTYISFYFVSNYLAHFTPQFLFISGAPHKQQHVQGVGEMYLFQLPLLLLGLYLLFKKPKNYKFILLSWLLISFIPVSVTNDSIPNALRTLIAAPVYQLICAFGFIEAAIFLKKKYNKKILYLFILLSAAIVFVSIFYYLDNYYNKYPYLYSRDWQYGYEQAVWYIKNNYSKYNKIVMTNYYGQPYMFVLFYLNFNPLKFQDDPNLVRVQTSTFISVLQFDKFYFPNLSNKETGYENIIKQNPGKKILFIGKENDFPSTTKILGKVNFLNGLDAFEIVENQ